MAFDKNDIEKYLEKEFSAAINPDHPFLVETSEILLGRNGNLIAIYFCRPNEISSLDKLLARVQLSKIALPSHTRHLLIYDKNLNEDIYSSIKMQFSEILELNNKKSLNGLVKDSAKEKFPVNDNLLHIQEEFLINYQINYRYMLESIDSTHKKKSFKPDKTYRQLKKMGYEEGEIFGWLKSKKPEKEIIFYPHETIVSTAYFEDKRNMKKNILNEINNSLKTNFLITKEGNLDKEFTYKNYLLIDSYPLQEYDPTKYLRALAFSGICGIQSDAYELDKITSDLIERKKKGFKFNKRDIKKDERN